MFSYSIVFCVLLISCINGRSDDVCFSLNRGSDDVSDPVGGSTLQGVPGKRGPKGSIGLLGPPGLPGQCACNPSEIEELREKIRQLEDSYCTIGMGDRRVRDEDITASSSWDIHHGPYAARLDNQRGLNGNAGNTGSWTAGHRHVGEWIQVHLHRPTLLTGVITQGRPAHAGEEWVKTFKISYGNSVNNLQVITDKTGNEMIFEGNTDRNSYSNNKFPQPVIARYIRLYPQTWNGNLSLRMEFLTC